MYEWALLQVHSCTTVPAEIRRHRGPPLPPPRVPELELGMAVSQVGAGNRWAISPAQHPIPRYVKASLIKTRSDVLEMTGRPGGWRVGSGGVSRA